MNRTIVQCAAIACAAAATIVVSDSRTGAQAPGSPVPFKLGTFARGGQSFIGLVLADTRVVNIPLANAAFEGGNASARKLTAPGDMKQLIAGYDGDWHDRLAAIARTVSVSYTHLTLPTIYSV